MIKTASIISGISMLVSVMCIGSNPLHKVALEKIWQRDTLSGKE